MFTLSLNIWFFGESQMFCRLIGKFFYGNTENENFSENSWEV